MRRLSIYLAVLLTLSYLSAVVAINHLGGEVQMLRIITDWPVFLLGSFAPYRIQDWFDNHDVVRVGLVAVFYALSGYLIGMAVSTWATRRMRSHRIAAGHCEQCGYDLQGNASGRCPECGVPVAQAIPDYNHAKKV